MSPKRITVSTSGVPKMIRKMADDGVKFKLAVSLHSAIDEIRTSIMPFNAKFTLADLREALEYWYQKTKKPNNIRICGVAGNQRFSKDCRCIGRFLQIRTI